MEARATSERSRVQVPSLHARRMGLRMDNVGIVVEDLSAAIEFFGELGLELEGHGLVEGEWAGRVTGLGAAIGSERSGRGEVVNSRD